MPNKRFILTSIGAVFITVFMIAANYQSPAIAAYTINDLRANPNIVHYQPDASHGGKDQMPLPLAAHIANDITSANFSMSCSGVSVSGTASPASGYAAFRVWDDTSGSVIIDSYQNVGKPMYYAAISGSGSFSDYIPYALPQPLGHAYRARVYRAPTNAFGSWDGGTYMEQSWTCIGTVMTSVTVYCNKFFMQGMAYPFSGYAALRIWAGSQTLVDSYVSGYPSHYDTIAGNGYWEYYNYFFSPQPPGTSITVRVYRAPSATTNSWDGGEYANYTSTCTQNEPTATFTPLP